VDALEQALWARGVDERSGLIHHSDRGSQYLAIRHADRLAEIGISPSVGSVGDSYDNALAETINGLYKTEVIRHQGPWRNLEDVDVGLEQPDLLSEDLESNQVVNVLNQRSVQDFLGKDLLIEADDADVAEVVL